MYGVTEQVTEQIYTEVDSTEQITSRSLEQPRTAESIAEVSPKPVINLELTVDSDLTVISNCTAEQFDEMLKGTKLEGLGSSLVKAEQESNVNGLYLMGLACLESSYGNSKYAKERNNLVGWNAVDSNPNKATYFTSKDECILYVANKLKTNYLTERWLLF